MSCKTQDIFGYIQFLLELFIAAAAWNQSKPHLITASGKTVFYFCRLYETDKRGSLRSIKPV